MPGHSTTEILDPAAPQAAPTDEVFAFVHALLVEIVGEDYLLDAEIGWDSNLQDDLALESLEFVTIAEQIGDRYGEAVDFVGWLSTLELEQIVKLTVGEIVEFVAAGLGGAPAEARADG